MIGGTGVAAQFQVNPVIVAFENVVVGQSATDTVTVTNGGGATLTISGVTSSNARFTVTPTTGNILPGDSLKFSITFSPIAVGLQTGGNIVFTHNASGSPSTVTAGEVLDGKYLIEYELGKGEGGMGRVYKARHKDLEMDVAVKVIRPDQKDDQNFRQRFDDEAKVMAVLKHDNIIRVSDYSTQKKYIIMDYLEGVSLKQKIQGEGPIPVPEALLIFKQVLSGLEYAHNKKKVFHRDIKPGNIFITKDNVTKVLDFGLATIRKSNDFTRTMIVAITPFYAAPEQRRGLGFADNRSDIYSVGVSLYEALLGKLPSIEDFDEEVRKEVQSGKFPSLSKIDSRLPEALVNIVMKAVEEDPEKRFQSATEMKEALDAVGINGAVPNNTSRWVRWWDRYGQVLTRSVITGVLGLTGYVFSDQIRCLILSCEELTVSSSVDSARVELNGRLIGLTPLSNIKVDPGIANIHVSKAGHVHWDTAVVVKEYDRIPSLFAPLPPVSRSSLTVRSIPSGAQVAINGQVVGVTPLDSYEVEPGSRAIRLIRSGHDVKDTIVVVEKNQHPLLSFTLIPKRATLTLRAVPNGRVYVDGNLSPNTVSLPPGNHMVRFENPSYGTPYGNLSRSIDLSPGQEASLTCYFQSHINVNVQDDKEQYLPGAWITLSGQGIQSQQTAPWQFTNVPPGDYTISVSLSGYVGVQNEVVQIRAAIDTEQPVMKKVFKLSRASSS